MPVRAPRGRRHASRGALGADPSGIRYAIGAVLVTLAALWVLGKQQNLIDYLILSSLLALALEPAVIWLHEKRGWRRGSATGLLLVAVFLSLVLLGFRLGGGARARGQPGRRPAPLLHRQAERVHAGPLRPDGVLGLAAGRRRQRGHTPQRVPEGPPGRHPRGDRVGVSAIFTVFTIGLFTFYLTAQGPQVRRALLSRVPPSDRSGSCSPGRSRSRRWGATCTRACCSPPSTAR